MKKSLFNVHFQLTHLIQITKFQRQLHFFLSAAVFFFSTSLFAEIKIAVVDTGLCPNLIKSPITLHSSIDFTKSVELICRKENIQGARFHGQMVVEEFLRHLEQPKETIDLYPLIVFDKNGLQKKEYWQAAIEWIKKMKIDFILSASGLKTTEELKMELPGIWFISSGRVAPGIDVKTSLFPQNLTPKNNLFLIGDFYDGKEIFYDQGLLYQDKIDYYFPAGDKAFQGTSRAVAVAAARALNFCSLLEMRSCLKKRRQEKKDQVSLKLFYSY